MTRPLLLSSLLAPLAACGSGDWVVSTWGEAFIEQGIAADEFEDGCSATFDQFTVRITEAALLDGDGEVAASAEPATVELTEPGPHELSTVAAPSTQYDTVRYAIESAGEPAIQAAGTLTCGAESVTFDWAFDIASTYSCAPDDLSMAKGAEVETELTIHGDHLFYDSLEHDDAVLRAQPMVDADGDGDGVVTLDELAVVDVAALGHRVGQQSDITDLASFVTYLVGGVGHVNGEGHCDVSR